MNKKYKIIVKMKSYWHVGSGKGGGVEVDSRIDRDSDDFPYVPGKMIKGVFRDACERLRDWGHKKYDFTGSVFGNATKSESGGLARFITSPGFVSVSDARLPEQVREKLKSESLNPALTRFLHSTKINEETGCAEDKSLRTIEVSVPMDLEAELEFPEEHFEELKVAVTSLVHNIGAHRSRGFGEVEFIFSGGN